jgi:hypothetical protein
LFGLLEEGQLSNRVTRTTTEEATLYHEEEKRASTILTLRESDL